jgi:predicted aldo/keto reductase-like oxidoreductase
VKKRKGAATPVSETDGDLPRRDFLLGAAALGLGLLPFSASNAAASPPTAAGSVPQPSSAGAGVKQRVTLGKTGLEVPDISMGCFKLREKSKHLVHAALDRGITHFDTADSYQKGASEKALGAVLADRRTQVTITSKHRAGAKETRQGQMLALENSLKRLRTDYIDIYLNHAMNDMERLQNPEWPEFVSRAKAQGKIRFAGISGHGGQLTRCIDYAVENDFADVILVAYAFAQDPDFFNELKTKLALKLDMVAPKTDLPLALDRARKKGVGVMAMKTLWGAKLNDMRPFEAPGTTFAQSAMRWVLTGKHVDGLVVTMRNTRVMDEYLGASGAAGVGAADLSMLQQYQERNTTTQCRYGCTGCLDACPSDVAISDVLRSRMYAVDYKDPEQGSDAYAKLEGNAAACGSCSTEPCANACPYGISISQLTRQTHDLLGT